MTITAAFWPCNGSIYWNVESLPRNFLVFNLKQMRLPLGKRGWHLIDVPRGESILCINKKFCFMRLSQWNESGQNSGMISDASVQPPAPLMICKGAPESGLWYAAGLESGNQCPHRFGSDALFNGFACAIGVCEACTVIKKQPDDFALFSAGHCRPAAPSPRILHCKV
jgi:hypothetical protein